VNQLAVVGVGIILSIVVSFPLNFAGSLITGLLDEDADADEGGDTR
jgi:hypothetical protein